jgi:O-antigen/teichoic acid export membrane protein
MASFITLPVITRALRPSDFGIVEMVSTTFMVAELVLSGNFADALTYFYNAALKRDDGGREARRVVQTSIAGALLLGCAGFLLGLAFSRRMSIWALGSPQYSRLFLISFVGFLGSLSCSVAANYLRAADKALLCVALGLVRLVLQTGLCVLLLAVMKMGVEGVMLGSTITTLVCAALSCIYLFWTVGFGFDPRGFAAQIKYSFPLALSGLGTLFAHYGDRYYLQRHVSLAEIGLYSLAYRIAMLVSVAHGPFLFYWMGDVYRIAGLEEGKSVTVRVFRFVTICLAGVAVALALFTRPVLAMMTTPDYYGAAVFAPWLLLAYVLRAMGDQIRSVFNTRARTWEHTLVSVAAVGAGVVSYGLLIPRYGAAGAVAATVLIFLSVAVVSTWRAQAVDPHDFEWGRIAVLCFVSFGVVALFSELAPAGLAAQFAAGIAGSIVWVFGIWLAGVFTAAERERIGGLVRNWIARPRTLAARAQ